MLKYLGFGLPGQSRPFVTGYFPYLEAPSHRVRDELNFQVKRVGIKF